MVVASVDAGIRGLPAGCGVGEFGRPAVVPAACSSARDHVPPAAAPLVRAAGEIEVFRSSSAHGEDWEWQHSP